MKKVLLSLLLMIGLVSSVFADGFVSLPAKYYYQVKSTINLVDEASPISPNVYVAVIYPGSTTYTHISDTLTWDRTDLNFGKASFEFIPNVIGSSATFGMFVNPDGIWQTTPAYTFNRDIVTSSGTFTHVPATYFTGGTGYTECKFNIAQLPPKIEMDYSYNEVDWQNVFTSTNDNPSVKETVNYEIHAASYTKGSDLHFRYVYPGTNIVIATSGTITWLPNQYFTFLTKFDTPIFDPNIVVNWETSFPLTYIKIYHNDSLFVNDSTHTKTYTLNTNNSGKWRFVATVGDGDFSLKNTLPFLVGDPCQEYKDLIDLLKADTSKLHKEIVTKNGRIETLEKTLKDTVEYWKGLKKDTLVTLIDSLKKVLLDVTDLNGFDTYQDGVIKSPATILVFDLLGKELDRYLLGPQFTSLRFTNYSENFLIIFVVKEGKVIQKFKYSK